MSAPAGLSSARAKELLAAYGPNIIQEERQGGLRKLLHAIFSSASLMLIAASALSFFIGRSFDGSFIASLWALNLGVSRWHEHKADRALEELRRELATSARVLRDGAWRQLPSSALVPGDVIECGVGALVPADVRTLEANNLQINEAVLTGESLPKEKQTGDIAYSGSAVVTGRMRGEVVATGNRAFFGKIALSKGAQRRRSQMERDILSISRFLILAALVAIAILTAAFLAKRQSPADTLLLDLSILIAGVPVSLPTVMTLILSLGALSLARRSALVRRLAALEDFANVTLLLTDKTGTLTRNEISVEATRAYAPFDERTLLSLVGTAASAEPRSIIEAAVVARAGVAKGSILEFTPADSVRKRLTALIKQEGKRYLVATGAPHVIRGLAQGADGAFEQDVTDAAQKGMRPLAVAVKQEPSGLGDEHGMQLAGLLLLADPLRQDARATLSFLRSEGVRAIMLTGDTKETAAHVAQLLGLRGGVVRPRDVDIPSMSKEALEATAAFAEVLPDDKLRLVERAQKDFSVAMAGDGVNDLPAVRGADVGMAVQGAVDALKGTADIVFLSPGISVMQVALIEARKIFFRLYNYSIYRISESLRLVITALVLGLIIGGFPLTPVQIILLAFLNDIPIITLAFDRVKRTDRPADLKTGERFVLGALYGLVGVANSLILYFLLAVLRAPLPIIQTAFFLKLTVSGHMLIYVAHTKERWWRYLPHWSVIAATSATQALATALALFGIFVEPISLPLVAFIWLWAFFWMQVTELMKMASARARGVIISSSPRMLQSS